MFSWAPQESDSEIELACREVFGSALGISFRSGEQVEGE